MLSAGAYKIRSLGQCGKTRIAWSRRGRGFCNYPQRPTLCDCSRGGRHLKTLMIDNHATTRPSGPKARSAPTDSVCLEQLSNRLVTNRFCTQPIVPPDLRPHTVVLFFKHRPAPCPQTRSPNHCGEEHSLGKVASPLGLLSRAYLIDGPLAESIVAKEAAPCFPSIDPWSTRLVILSLTFRLIFA